MAISRSIVDAVRSMKPPGRFLDKDPETGLWHDIGDRKAIEKTSQALRDGAADLRRQLSEDLGDPDFLNAVFETDNAKNSADSLNSGSNHSKEKAKPFKAKPPIKKGHRRTKSNPSTLEERKKIFFKKQHRADLVEPMPERPMSPRTSIGSLPSSPSGGRPTFGRAASFDYAHSSPYPGSPPPSNHMGSYYPPHTVSGTTTLKCASFDSAQRAHSWQYTGRRSGHPPLSPSTMRGRYPLSPPGSYSQSRPPISPVQKSAWSPGGYGRPSPPLRSWRASSSPYGYSPGELSVPTLGRKGSGSSSPRVPLSPMRPSSAGAQENAFYRPPPIIRAGSAEDFVPPLSPGSWNKPKDQKIIVAKPLKESRSMEMDVDDNDDAKYQSSNCTLFGSLFGGCFMMDTERSDVEVVLSKDNKGEKIEVNPADDDNQSQRSLSPLPFRRNESESSAANFFNTLLQLPIAPCAPQDVE